MVPDFRVSRGAEGNPEGILRERVKTRRGDLRRERRCAREGVTWLIFELRLQAEITRLIYESDIGFPIGDRVQ